MKLKMKFDKKAVLNYLFQYGERAVFACVVLCFLFFVYKSFARERFETTPQDLKKAADSADVFINNSEPKNDKKFQPVVEIIEEISDPISEESYAIKHPFNPHIFIPKSKRGEPTLFAVEHLRATPGVGQVDKSMRGGVGVTGMGGRGDAEQEMEPLGSRWVMLTGLVDFKKQSKAFYEAFKDAVYKNPQTDQAPMYYAFWVERAEVPESENVQDQDLKWEPPYKSLRAELEKCGGAGSFGGSDGYVAPYYLHDRLSFPLPKRLDEDWDDAVAHPPEIPLLSLLDANTMPEKEIKEENQEETDDAGAAFGGQATGMGGRMGPGMGMEGGRMGMARGGMMPGMGMEGGRMGMARGGMGAGLSEEQLSPYLLFRFIDFNVEPGKQYKYRVRLGFFNPNFEVEPRFLIPELQELIAADKNRPANQKRWKRYIQSPWSEPSDTAAVPRDDQLLLVSVEPARKVDADPKAKIMAVHWDMQNGIKLSDEFADIIRGKVANFLEHKITTPAAPGGMGPGAARGGEPGAAEGGGRTRQPARGTPGDRRDRRTGGEERGGDGLLGGPMGGGMGMPGMGGGFGGAPTLPEKVDIKTDCLVLDLRGGDRLEGKNRDLYEPGEMLLLDPDGNLVVRSDVEDFEQYRKNKYPSRQNQQMPRGRGGMGMPGGMGMRGGPGMMEGRGLLGQ